MKIFGKISGPYSRSQLYIGMILTCLVLHTCFATNSFANEIDRRLVWTAVELFPSFLAADRNIEQKRDLAGNLCLIIIYQENKRLADEISKYLKDIGDIKKFPIKLKTVSLHELKNNSFDHIAGIFLVEKLYDQIKKVIEIGKSHHVLVFSPFEEDLQSGVCGSIAISDIVVPVVNERSLKSFDIWVNPFFLRIAEKYE